MTSPQSDHNPMDVIDIFTGFLHIPDLVFPASVIIFVYELTLRITYQNVHTSSATNGAGNPVR